MTAPRNDQHQFKSILAKPAPSTHDSTFGVVDYSTYTDFALFLGVTLPGGPCQIRHRIRNGWNILRYSPGVRPVLRLKSRRKNATFS